MATQRNYRKFTAQQKLEIVLAGLRGDRSVKDVCRDHEIAETLYYSWRDKLLEGGRRPPAACDETKVSAAARRGDTRNAARDIVRKRREHSCFARRLSHKCWRTEPPRLRVGGSAGAAAGLSLPPQ